MDAATETDIHPAEVANGEVETSYHWWRDAGCPGVGQWRFTITAGGQHVELLPSPD